MYEFGMVAVGLMILICCVAVSVHTPLLMSKEYVVEETGLANGLETLESLKN
ncbi:MAG: hypothetical protein VX141_00175 [Bacteroidota bacterium]|nr:hypothetical protein [Bacteroidota bacterium]